MDKYDRCKGGLYGLLIGDALGVPYEFHSAEQIPPYDEIEMIPPRGFRRTYTGVAPGTWSDDGAQMRVLPLALWHTGTERELVLDAHAQCVITHGNLCNQVCCALYCLVARFLLKGEAFPSALEKAVSVLREIYEEIPVYAQELEWSVRPEEPWIGQGSGYVVDCLRSAFMILLRAESYEEAVKQAIQLGDDTDTTACVTGGLAGILFGFDAIPKRWYEALRGKDEIVCMGKGNKD